MEKHTSGQKEQAPTQKLDRHTKIRKRRNKPVNMISTSVASQPERLPEPKRLRLRRLIGYRRFTESQSERQRESIPEEQSQPQAIEVEELVNENELPRLLQAQTPSPATDNTRHVSAMLQEVESRTEIVVPEPKLQCTRRKHDSDTSQTPLASTQVSSGKSLTLIRKHWGTEGVMVKIMCNMKAGVSPLTVKGLVAKGPIVTGYTPLIAARCFTSILKLKQHGFIKVEIDDETLEITDIRLGPRFDGF